MMELLPLSVMKRLRSRFDAGQVKLPRARRYGENSSVMI